MTHLSFSPYSGLFAFLSENVRYGLTRRLPIRKEILSEVKNRPYFFDCDLREYIHPRMKKKTDDFEIFSKWFVQMGLEISIRK